MVRVNDCDLGIVVDGWYDRRDSCWWLDEKKEEVMVDEIKMDEGNINDYPDSFHPTAINIRLEMRTHRHIFIPKLKYILQSIL